MPPAAPLMTRPAASRRWVQRALCLRGHSTKELERCGGNYWRVVAIGTNGCCRRRCCCCSIVVDILIIIISRDAVRKRGPSQHLAPLPGDLLQDQTSFNSLVLTRYSGARKAPNVAVRAPSLSLSPTPHPHCALNPTVSGTSTTTVGHTAAPARNRGMTWAKSTIRRDCEVVVSQ
jgi:hypothetical protein